MLPVLVSLLGFLLLLLLCTEEFRGTLWSFWKRQTSGSSRKYLAYPLAFLAAVAALGLIAFSMWLLLSSGFSYD